MYFINRNEDKWKFRYYIFFVLFLNKLFIEIYVIFEICCIVSNFLGFVVIEVEVEV